MESTVVEMKCVSKKETENYNKEFPVNTEIEFTVPFDQKSIFYQMSGGTTLKLNTVNQAAADMFALGGFYQMVISKKKPEPTTTGTSA